MVLVSDVVCEREGLVSLTVVDLESEWGPSSKIAIVGIAMQSLRHTLRTNRTYQNEVFRWNKSKIISTH
jgi:hypothetical protein